MLHPKMASALAAFCLYGLASPAAAGVLYGEPRVIPGIGPEGSGAPALARGPEAEPGRYGGGLLELMITGRDPTPALVVPRVVPTRPDRAYVASAPYGEPLGEPDVDPRSAYAPAPGYEMPHKAVDPAYLRQEVTYHGPQKPGTIVIDTGNKFLYLVESGGRALRYGIGVGRPGFLWRGEKTITRKAEWPGWTPPSEMLKRRPDLPAHMEGGIANPLGARAMYLGSSLYRIHGTNEPDTIGTNVSSGCIRLTNDDVSDLFGRVRVGTKVIVL